MDTLTPALYEGAGLRTQALRPLPQALALASPPHAGFIYVYVVTDAIWPFSSLPLDPAGSLVPGWKLHWQLCVGLCISSGGGLW